jgi:hypothetical protein
MGGTYPTTVSITHFSLHPSTLLQALLGWHFSLWPPPSNWSSTYTDELKIPLNYTGSSNQPAFNQQALLDAISEISSEEMHRDVRVRNSIRTKVYTNEMKHMVNAIQLVCGVSLP